MRHEQISQLEIQDAVGDVALAIAQPPFWDQSGEPLLRNFEKFREVDDSANMVACFSRMSDHLFAECSHHPDFDPTKKSIVSIFQPKSGGTFLHNRMLGLGYKEFWWCISHRLCDSVCYAIDEALERYLAGGCTSHNHARPHPNILAAWDRVKVEQVWVHIRNPAACAVSAYHHYKGEGHGEGDLGIRRKIEALLDAVRLGIGTGKGIDEFVLDHIEWHVEWVESWLRYANDRPGRIVFSYYQELSNPQSLLSRIFEEFGVELSACVMSAPLAHDRFRKKKTSDWRHELSSTTVGRIERLVQDRLSNYPEFALLWT